MTRCDGAWILGPMGQHGRALGLIATGVLISALALGCGGNDEPEEAEVPGSADPDATRVIEDWATALREGDVEGAAEYFELPSIAQNGTPPLELDSREDVILFNRARHAAPS